MEKFENLILAVRRAGILCVMLVVFASSLVGCSAKEKPVKLTDDEKHDQFVLEALQEKYGIEFVIVGEGKHPNKHRFLNVSPADHPEIIIVAAASKGFDGSSGIPDFSSYGYHLNDNFPAVGLKNYEKILKEAYPDVSFYVPEKGGAIVFNILSIEDMHLAYNMIQEIDPVRDHIMPFNLREEPVMIYCGKLADSGIELDTLQKKPRVFFNSAAKQCLRLTEESGVDPDTLPLEFFQYITDRNSRSNTTIHYHVDEGKFGIITMFDADGNVCVPHEQLIRLLVDLGRSMDHVHPLANGNEKVYSVFNYFGYYEAHCFDDSSLQPITFTWQLDGNSFRMDDNEMGAYWKNGERFTLPLVTISYPNCDETTTAYYIDDVMDMLGDSLTYEYKNTMGLIP